MRAARRVEGGWGRRPGEVGFALGLLGAAWCGGCASQAPADLVLLSGKVVTLEPGYPEVEALAARAGRILAVGSDAEIRRHIGRDTRVIDLRGRVVLPGFIEGHGHFTGLGRSLSNLDLRGARTFDELVERVAAAAAARSPGEWILGWGWHQEKWDAPPEPSVEGYPTHDALSRAVPNHPVLLKHAAGNHAGLVNAAAMALAGIDERMADPPGGSLLRDANGHPTGVLRENAYALALAAYERDRSELSAEQREAERRREIELADQECLRRGVTSFQDAGSDFATVDLLRSMAEAGQLGVRLWVMLGESNDALAARLADYRIIGAGHDHLTVRAIKRYMDGALGSHGAWLLEPYDDQPASSGLNTVPLADIERTAELALAHGFQLCVHAIGDRANRETLDLYERALAMVSDGRDRRWRIEHAQHLDRADVPRFSRLGVLASMQGIHCTSDASWVPTRLGPRRAAEGAYVWRSLLDSGARVSNGTDAPIESVDPIANFHATVTRRDSSGRVFHPEQRMSRMEALRAATIDAAYAAFEEGSKGSLAPGKHADLVVLSDDPLAVPEEHILDVRVVLTIVGGVVRYEG